MKCCFSTTFSTILACCRPVITRETRDGTYRNNFKWCKRFSNPVYWKCFNLISSQYQIIQRHTFLRICTHTCLQIYQSSFKWKNHICLCLSVNKWPENIYWERSNDIRHIQLGRNCRNHSKHQWTTLINAVGLRQIQYYAVSHSPWLRFVRMASHSFSLRCSNRSCACNSLPMARSENSTRWRSLSSISCLSDCDSSVRNDVTAALSSMPHKHH